MIGVGWCVGDGRPIVCQGIWSIVLVVMLWVVGGEWPIFLLLVRCVCSRCVWMGSRMMRRWLWPWVLTWGVIGQVDPLWLQYVRRMCIVVDVVGCGGICGSGR